MNASTAVLLLLAFVISRQYVVPFILPKPGSCPMYKVISESALCEQETAECTLDQFCPGDLKCCEDERCGVSKCIKPVVEILPTRPADRCPVEDAYQSTGCRPYATKFCFISKCQRCCTHTSNCNPAKDVLVKFEECKQRTTINRTKSMLAVKSGQSVVLECQLPKENSLRRWSKIVNGESVYWTEAQTEVIDKDLVLKISKAVVADSGQYLCESVYHGMKYVREVQLTVDEPDNYENVCLMAKVAGNCSFNFQHYYYDVIDDSCKAFQYGGCGGNNNNFADISTCEQKCKGTRQSCPNMTQAPKECPKDVTHECANNENCSSRMSCCLVGCMRKCIDPSKPPTLMPQTTSTKAPPVTARVYIPCGGRKCEFYSECREGRSGVKECQCPRSCNFVGMKRVCGMDKKLNETRRYRSMCFLKIRSCMLQREIRHVPLHECDKKNAITKDGPVSDLCSLKECPPYANCVINRFDKQPQCLCPRFCRLVRKLVCGSDGQTYRNECFLRVLSCGRNLNVRIMRPGRC